MDASDACQDLQRRIGALFTCSDHGDYQRIHTPYLYPDGDNIDLFCRVDGDTLTVSDLAETTGWLRMQSATLRRSLKQTRLIEDACVTQGIEFYRGMLQARCRSGDELAQVVHPGSAGSAPSIRPCGFSFRSRLGESITDEVADFLNERELAFDRAEKLVGRSGRGWTVDFHAPCRATQLVGPGAEHRQSRGGAPGLGARARRLARPESPRGGTRGADLRLAVRRHRRCLGGRGLSAGRALVDGVALVAAG